MSFNVADALDDLRQLIAKADALACATEDLFDQMVWSEDETDDGDRQRERLAHLIAATSSAVLVALEVGNELAGQLAMRRHEA